MIYAKRYFVSTLTFLVLMLWVTFSSLTIDHSPKDDVGNLTLKTQSFDENNYMYQLRHFITEGQQKKLSLLADKMSFTPGAKQYHLDVPNGVTYGDEEQTYFFKSKKGFFDLTKNFLSLEEEVVLIDQANKIEANKIDYDVKAQIVTAEGDVFSKTVSDKTKDSVELKSKKLVYYPEKKISEYSGEVRGLIIRPREYEGRVHVKSETLVADLLNNKINLLDNVYIKKQQVTGTSRRGEIFLENFNKKLKYYALYDDVKIEETLKSKDGKVITRKAFSEKLEGIVHEQKILLTGDPRVIQGDNLITGNEITIYEKTEVIKVDDSTSNLILNGE